MVLANCKVRHDYNILHVYCAIHKGRKVKSAYESSGYQARVYPSFSSMKRLGVFLLPPGWDASPSQGYPLAFNLLVPVYTLRVKCPVQEHNIMSPGTAVGCEPRPLALKSNALIIRPLHLPQRLMTEICCSLIAGSS